MGILLWPGVCFFGRIASGSFVSGSSVSGPSVSGPSVSDSFISDSFVSGSFGTHLARAKYPTHKSAPFFYVGFSVFVFVFCSSPSPRRKAARDFPKREVAGGTIAYLGRATSPEPHGSGRESPMRRCPLPQGRGRRLGADAFASAFQREPRLLRRVACCHFLGGGVRLGAGGALASGQGSRTLS